VEGADAGECGGRGGEQFGGEGEEEVLVGGKGVRWEGERDGWMGGNFLSFFFFTKWWLG
jgi:hypothetical protein